MLNLLNYNEPVGECVPIPTLTDNPIYKEIESWLIHLYQKSRRFVKSKGARESILQGDIAANIMLKLGKVLDSLVKMFVLLNAAKCQQSQKGSVIVITPK